jgi:hypothetical protein
MITTPIAWLITAIIAAHIVTVVALVRTARADPPLRPRRRPPCGRLPPGSTDRQRAGYEDTAATTLERELVDGDVLDAALLKR